MQKLLVLIEESVAISGAQHDSSKILKIHEFAFCDSYNKNSYSKLSID